MRAGRFTIVWAYVFAGCVVAQVAEKANEGYKTPEARRGMIGALTDPTRDARQRPRELVAALGIRPGMTVIDFGSGPGYMLPHLSEAVGSQGQVISQDIFPDFLAEARKRTAGLKNVSFVQGNAKESKLSAKSADLILVLDVYHHLDYPQETLAQLRAALKPGGRLAIVEYHKNDVAMNGRAKEHVRLAESDAVAEIEANGFRLKSKSDFVPQVQWLGMFEAK
jgi:ubiquinone/menaquinone biosynthesis C-methylase UbiE